MPPDIADELALLQTACRRLIRKFPLATIERAFRKPLDRGVFISFEREPGGQCVHCAGAFRRHPPIRDGVQRDVAVKVLRPACCP